MLVKYGDKNLQVAEIQKLLSQLGYDLIIDGHFGKRTLRSVKSFQKKNRLEVDGIVGDKTYSVLKLSQRRTAKELKEDIAKKQYENLEIITDCTLAPEQYIKQIFEKKQIFIHFTAGGPNAANVIKYWDSNESRIATAFVISRNGKIYQAYHPDYWSYHLGIKGSKGKLDKVSIGIEICAYGPLKKKNDKYYAWPNNWGKEIPADEVYKLEELFRGYSYFHSYSDEQMKSVEKLVSYLVKEYDISVQNHFDENWYEFKQSIIDNVTPGIHTHVNCRKDKSDSYPDKRLTALLNRIAKKNI